MPDPDHFHANLQRGSLLLNQDRPREALPYIQAAIAANPDAPQGYAELARCWNALPSTRAKSIQAINRAIGLAPDSSYYQGLKGWYLVCLMRFREALATAQKGLAIDPHCTQSLNALANAYTKLGQWKKAEAACRRILEYDPNDGPGLNLLAQALRHLGRWKEMREVVAQLLANMPNNAFGHANAGYAALAAGDHLRANEHFLESLRMNPHFDLARRGLLQSLNARIWIVRFNMRISSVFRLQPSQGAVTRFALWAVASFVGLAIVASLLEWIYPSSGMYLLVALFIGLIGFFLLLVPYVYFSAIVAILGRFLLLFDPLGRQALTRKEKIMACMPVIPFILIAWAVTQAGYPIVAMILSLLIVFLALSIQFPLIRDRWLRRRALTEE